MRNATAIHERNGTLNSTKFLTHSPQWAAVPNNCCTVNATFWYRLILALIVTFSFGSVVFGSTQCWWRFNTSPPPRSNQECAPPPKSSSPPSWWWRRHNRTCCNIHNLGIWTRLWGTKHKIRQLQSNCLNQLHVITQLIRGGYYYLVHFDKCRTIKTTVGAKHCFCLTEMVVREWRAGAGARCMAEVSTASWLYRSTGIPLSYNQPTGLKIAR